MNKKGENRKFSHCNFLPKNNRGQDLSTSTIILIILGIAVLVILVIGFMLGWNKVLPFLNQPNVDTIVSQCQTSCTTSNVYDYCSAPKTLIASDLPKDAKGKAQTSVIANCTFFSTDKDYLKYNIGACPSLCSTPATTTP